MASVWSEVLALLKISQTVTAVILAVMQAVECSEDDSDLWREHRRVVFEEGLYCFGHVSLLLASSSLGID